MRATDTLYVERSGGQWEGWAYSDRRRVYLIRHYDYDRLLYYARKHHYRILKVK